MNTENDPQLDEAGFDALVEQLTAAAAAYYDSSTLTMTDAEYDDGVAQVADLLAEHPEWASEASGALLGEVAAGQSAGGDVTHPTRMLSIDKVTLPQTGDAEGRDEVFADVTEFTTKIGEHVAVEPKMDGLAVRAAFERGRLVLAATRGDGSTGEDITDRVRRGISGLPVEVDGFSGEVRGEVYMTTSDFERANELRVAGGDRPFVNPRNGTAGALRKSGDVAMPMHFAVYDLSGDGAESSHVERMTYAATLGFGTALTVVGPVGVQVVGPGDVRAAVEAIEEARPGLDFEIDGVVVKADRDDDRGRLGEGSRTPYWALAVKFPAEEASSVVEAIEVSVGRTGRLAVRARITPTFVGGTTVTYATLHNAPWVVEQGIGVGSKVVLKRAGDVIPRITAPLDTEANKDVAPWVPPETCPKCGEPWNKSSLLWRCETPSCGLVNAVDYWASRDAMDIEGLGGAVAEKLVDQGLVNDVADLYSLTVEQLATLAMGTTSTGNVRLLGEANATKIHKNLEASKQQPFNRVITGLGMRMTGRSVGRWLAREFPTMERLRAASVDEIAEIDKMGQIKAQAVADGLERMSDVIDRLAAAGVNMGSEPERTGHLPLDGMTFVVSGSVPGYNRTTAQEAIEAAGGKATSSVSKSTTGLITDETTTSKAKKATQLGIPIIDPGDFATLLEKGPDGLS
ncbi:MAG: NAD-dependent DNA ligase LigA [Nocardioides sp.]|nr:NAD-dependent DNA ligase LigA [Nocardioides sp.]